MSSSGERRATSSEQRPPRLRRGDLLPRLLTPVPGPRARALSRRLAAAEAAAIGTVAAGPNLLWAEALGSNVLDVDGNRFLDLTSGFGAAAVGHRHPRVVAAVRRQAARLLHGLGDVHAHGVRLALAERLVAAAPLPEARAWFAISGADAIEVALETALLATGRPGVIAFSGAYHGLTLGARAVSSRRRFREPFLAHLTPHVTRLPFAAAEADLAAALSAAPRPGAVVVEPIQGREGVRLPPAGWLATLARLCREHGVLLILDEVLTGGGRTGTLFACQQEGVEPDLLCAGKALAGGLPFAVVLGRRPLLAAWPADGEALRTATFLAHPLACAAALAVLELLDGDLLAAAGRLGARLGEALAPWPEQLAGVTAVRGRGALWGIEVAAPGGALAWAERPRQQGLLVLSAGEDGRVLELLPAYGIAERQLAAALAILAATAPR